MVRTWPSVAYADRAARAPATLLVMSADQLASAIACRDLANPGGVVAARGLPAEASVLHGLVWACRGDADRSARPRLAAALQYLSQRMWTGPDGIGVTPFGLACRHPQLQKTALPVLQRELVPPDSQGQLASLELVGHAAACKSESVELRFRQCPVSGRTKCHDLSAIGHEEAVNTECHATPALGAVMSVANELPVDHWPGSAAPSCLDPHMAMLAAAELATKGPASHKQVWKDRLLAIAAEKRFEGFVVVARAAIAAELGAAGTALLSELAGPWAPPPDAAAALGPAAGAIVGADTVSPWLSARTAPLYGVDTQPLRAAAGRAVIEAARLFRLAKPGGAWHGPVCRLACPEALWAVGGIPAASGTRVPEDDSPGARLLAQSKAEDAARLRQFPLEVELRAPTIGHVDVAAAATEACTNVVGIRVRDSLLPAASLEKLVSSLASAADLQEVDMAGTSLSVSHVKSLALVVKDSSRRTINLSSSSLTAEGVTELASAMARAPEAVENLSLADNIFDTRAWERSLQGALASGACARGHVDLSGCGLRDVSWLAEAAKSPSFAVQTIDLSRNQLGDASAGDLATFVKRANGVVSLLLGGNSLSSTGVSVIARALGQSVPSLWTVSLAANPVDSEVGAVIAAAIGPDHRLSGRALAPAAKRFQATTAAAAFTEKLKAAGVTSVAAGELSLPESASPAWVDALGAATALAELDLSGVQGLRGETAKLLSAQVTANSAIATLNLAHSDLDNTGLSFVAETLSSQDHVTSLDLTACPADEDAGWAQLAASSIAHGLKRLEVGKTAFPESAAQALAVGSTSLETLALPCPAAAPVVAILGTCTSLSELSVTGGAGLNDSGTRAIIDAVATANRVKILRLSGCGTFATESGNALARLLNHPTASAMLVELEVAASQMSAGAVRCFAAGLAKATSLTRLSFADQSGIGDDGCGRVCNSIKALPALAELDLTRVGASGSAAAAGVKSVLEGCTALTTLRVGGNAWADDGCNVFAPAVASSPKLQRLDVSSCEMRERGVATLAAKAKSCASLVELNVSRNWAGALGGAALADAVKGPAGLTVLRASCCGLGGEQVLAVAAACQADSRIASLALARNSASTAAAKELVVAVARCNPLVEVDLHGNSQIGDGAVAELAAAAAAKATMRRLDVSSCLHIPESAILAQLLASATSSDCAIVW